jgi:hypothetical protein
MFVFESVNPVISNSTWWQVSGLFHYKHSDKVSTLGAQIDLTQQSKETTPCRP